MQIKADKKEFCSIKTKQKETKMSKRDQKRFVNRLLVRSVRIKGINGKVTVNDMFSRGNNAVVVLSRKDGDLLAIGV